MSKELYIFLAILIMAIVTYIPRAIPISFMKHEIKNKYVKSFLFYVPYAVIAALIFPSILYVTDNMIIASIGAYCISIIIFPSKAYCCCFSISCFCLWFTLVIPTIRMVV